MANYNYGSFPIHVSIPIGAVKSEKKWGVAPTSFLFQFQSVRLKASRTPGSSGSTPVSIPIGAVKSLLCRK